MLIGPSRQLALALTSPLALFALPKKTWTYFFLYLGLCGAVLGGAAYLFFSSEDLIRDIFLAYLFPDSWHGAMGFLADRFLESQTKLLLGTIAAQGSLLLVTLLLFPFKEMLSASFEREAGLINEPVSEHPLREQAWEEIKLFLGVIALQGTVYAVAYVVNSGWLAVAASVAGTVLLYASFAIDFMAPPFQRHEGYYSQILKTLAAHPIASLTFGAIFSAPALVGFALFERYSLETAVGLTCAIQVVGVAWAAVAGTWLGSKLYPDFKRTKRSSGFTRVATWLLLGGLLVGNGYVYGSLSWAVHKKSQLLKCDYSLVWTSFDVDLPGITGLIGDRVDFGVSFEVEIENPTLTPVELENNRIELRHDGDLLGTARLEPFRVDAKSKATQRVGAKIEVAPSFILKRRLSLLDRDKWKITLYIAITSRLELPIYLVQ